MPDKAIRVLGTALDTESVCRFFQDAQETLSHIFEETRWVISWWYFIPVPKRKKMPVDLVKLLSTENGRFLLEKTCEKLVSDMDAGIKPLLHSLDRQIRLLSMESAVRGNGSPEDALGGLIDSQAHGMDAQHRDWMLLADDIYSHCSQMIPLLKQGFDAGKIQKRILNVQDEGQNLIINQAAELYQKVSAIRIEKEKP